MTFRKLSIPRVAFGYSSWFTLFISEPRAYRPHFTAPWNGTKVLKAVKITMLLAQFHSTNVQSVACYITILHVLGKDLQSSSGLCEMHGGSQLTLKFLAARGNWAQIAQEMSKGCRHLFYKERAWLLPPTYMLLQDLENHTHPAAVLHQDLIQWLHHGPQQWRNALFWA